MDVMGMLDRIKKRQIEGFKEFVVNLETTPFQARAQIFTTGMLEDPVYMSYVMKNIKSFEDVLTLDSEEMETVLTSQEQVLPLMAKCLHGTQRVSDLVSTLPQISSKIKDELSYISEVCPKEKEGARCYILKLVRKFQLEEKIYGFRWELPPLDLYYQKLFKDGPHSIFFESGIKATEGCFEKGKRTGTWKHFYDTGSLLAEGDYLDGQKTGVWVFYYSNGKRRSEGKYESDLKHGLWQEWDRSGEQSQVEYAQGERKT